MFPSFILVLLLAFSFANATQIFRNGKAAGAVTDLRQLDPAQPDKAADFGANDVDGNVPAE